MAIAQHIILPFAGIVANIPSGWSRVTDLDGLFPKATAAATEPNVPGGAATHVHTSPAHSHTMDAHTHLIVTSYESSGQNDSDSSGSEGIPGSHRHNDTPPSLPLSGGGLSSVTATYGAASNNPAFYDVIFITPSGASASLEANILALWNIASVPADWTFCDGSNGTPDLRNRFLRGAGAGLGAGVTGDDSINIHALTHTHTEVAHTHTGQNYGIDDGGGNRGQGGNNYVSRGHKHPYYLNASSAGGISNATLTTVETVEPAYKKLMVIKNTSGGVNQPQSLIGMYKGALNAIPAGWRLCDGANGTPDLRDKWVKVANNSGELGATGGSNTHTHGSQNHIHTGSGHVHTGYLGGPDHSVGKTVNGVGGNRQLQNGGNVHSIQSVGSTAVTWAAAATTADSSNNESPFLTVAYVMYTGTPIAEDRAFETRGQVADDEERAMEVTGVDPSEERRFEVTGKKATNNERGFEVSGMIEWTRVPKPGFIPYS